MRCCGVTKQVRRCKRKEQKWYYPFCIDHRRQPFYLLISIGTALIFVSDLAESVGFKKPIEYVKTTNANNKHIEDFQSIFQPDDSISFNVLILRFEDYIEGKDTECIGLSIEEHLNVVQSNKDLPLLLSPQYVDSITRPKTIDEAKKIQDKHNADLIIYGLARNVHEDCGEADICFRYNIADQVVAQVTPAIQVKKTKHDLSYLSTSPMALEKGVLQIDALSIEYWITSLINIKANNPEKAFLELDQIGSDSTLEDTDRAIRFLTIACTYSDLNQHNKALEAIDRAIQLDPNNTKAYNNRGASYSSLNQYEHAIADYNKAIQLAPNIGYSYYNRGLAYANLSQYERATVDYSQAVQLSPSFASAYNSRGVAYYHLKQYERAVADLDKAIQLDPNSASTYFNRGRVYGILEQLERAIVDYDKAIQLDPQYMQAYNNRGASYLELNQYEYALSDFAKVILLNPNFVLVYINRSSAYSGLKQYERAIADLDTAIQLVPNFAVAYYARGRAYSNLEQYERAIADYDKAIQLVPNYEVAIKNRALVYEKLRKKKSKG